MTPLMKGFDSEVFGQNERKAMSMSLLDRSLSSNDETADADTGKAAYPAQDPEFILSHCDSVESSGFVQHLKLPHYVDFQSELVPFGGREMPLPYGWGTGGIQLTASVIGPDDRLKVIDQGSDDTVNAISIKHFFRKTAGITRTEDTETATIIQTRHRIPETPLKQGQIMVFQVPIPEPLQFIEPKRPQTLKMHISAGGNIGEKLMAAGTRHYGKIRILVTHDLAVARLLCHRLYVMKQGEIVESGLSDQILDDSRKPYTQLLVSSVLKP